MYANRLRALLLLVGLALASGHALAALPSFEAVRVGELGSDTRVLDRHGELLQRLRSNPQRRQGEWVRLADMSPALRNALILSEDRRFFEHSGVDWQAAAAAAWAACGTARRAAPPPSPCSSRV